MSKILIDMSPLRYPYTGLGQFCFYLGNYMSQLFTEKEGFSKESVDFLGFSNSKKYFEMSAKNWQSMYWIRRHSMSFIQKQLFKKYDLWHATAQNFRIFPPHTQTRFLLTIHDIIPFQEAYDVKKKQKEFNLLQKRINRATGITFISAYTQQETQKYFDLRNIPQRVIYNGVEIKNFDNPTKPFYMEKTEHSSHKPFIFTIGAIVPRKNFAVLLPFLAQTPDYQLVIAGKNNTEYAGQIRQEIQKYGLDNRVILAGEVSEEAKYWLYKNCDAFVFPSISEGFGLPVIEAMLMGKPVFTTQYTSLPEVGGQRAFYWNDFSPEKMKMVFENGMNISKIEENFAQNQINHAKKFTWEIASKNYWDFYQEFL
jgi:glycosyltransferase involved in cell wall biosynthesis